jgi:hypothetical protein
MSRVYEMVGPFPTATECDRCLRVVPIAPHRLRSSVPHVRLNGTPCTGNRKREAVGALDHPALALARQYATLDDDSIWDL